MKKKAALKQPRNPFTVQLINRGGAGVHGKTVKAKRTKAKAELKRGLSDSFLL